MEEVIEIEVDESPQSFSGYLKKTWFSFAGSIASTLSYSFTVVAVPFFLGHIIDAFKARKNPIISLDDFFDSPEFHWSLALGGAYIGFQGVNILRNYCIKRTAINMQNLILPKVLERTVALTYTENQNLKKGEIDQKLAKLQSNLETFFSSIISSGSACIELGLAMTVVALKFEYEFSLYLGAIALFNVGAMVSMSYFTRPLDKEKIKAEENLSFIIRDIVENYETIKVSSKEKDIIQFVAKPVVEIWFKQNKKSILRADGFSFIKDMMLGIFATYIVMRALYVLMTRSGRLIDDITYVVLYLRQIIGASALFDTNYKKVMSSYRDLRTVIDILSKPIEVQGERLAHYPLIQKIECMINTFELGNKVQPDKQEAINVNESTQLIPAEENRSKKEEKVPHFLGPLAFKLILGTFTGVAGGSASGKTVVMQFLFRFFDLAVNQGRISLHFLDRATLDIQGIPLRMLRQQICYTPQHSSIFDTTLQHNITLEKQADVNMQAYLEALSKVQFTAKEIKATAKEMKMFSGGQRQRIGLARAFYKYSCGCRIFIFDESTSALDAKMQSAIIQEIYKMREKGAMVIFVAHRLCTLQWADQILFFDKKILGDRHQTLLEVQRSDESFSAFNRLRKKSPEFNALVASEFGEDVVVNPGRSWAGMYSPKAERWSSDVVSQPTTRGSINGSYEKWVGNSAEKLERHGLFLHEKKDSAEKQNEFTRTIPEEFSLGEAKGKGDCFYDSCAQELNELSGRERYTVKLLRLLCHEYTVALDKYCRGNPKHPDNWIGASFNNPAKYQEYLANVRYTVEEREMGQGVGNDRLAIWGEQHLDGRIICEKLGIKLHVVEVRENPDEGTNKRQKFMVNHNLVDNTRLRNLDAEAIDWNDKKTIHIGVCNLHFVPILKKVTLQKSPSYPFEIYNRRVN